MSKTRMGKRVASLLLSLVMMLSLLPTTVYATEDTGGGTGETSGANVEATNTFDEGGTTSDPEAASEDEGGGANVSEGETATVAKVGDTEYATLAEAIGAAQSGETVFLVSDVELTDTLTVVNKDVTLDVGTFTLTVATSGDGISVENATLTLVGEGKYVFDCSASGSDGIYVANTDAGTTSTLNLNGNVDINVSGNVYSAIHAYASAGKAVVNINAGTITARGSNQFPCVVVDQNATLNMTGGTFDLSMDFDAYSDGNDVVGVLIWGNDHKQENCTVNISGGTFKVGGKNAFAQAVQVGMTNGYSKNCTVNISGGEVILNPTENGKGYVYATYKTTYATAEITGGTVSGSVTAIINPYITVTEVANDGLTISGGNFSGIDVAEKYLAEGCTYDSTTGEVSKAATVVKPVSVNGTSYATLEDAIDAATPDANGVITYEISGKVDVTATGWVQVAKSGLTGLTAVKFVGTTNDAAIYVTKEDAVLADQVYGNVDVSFSGLTLVKENPTYLNDYAEFTQYFAMEIRATVKTGVVTYTDCKFPEGVINNTYGKTVFTGCEFSNDDSRYNLWVKEGEVELNNGAFTGTRGVKLYNTGNAKATITIKDTTFDGLTGKAAIVVSQPAPADVTLENVTARNCTVGLIQKDTATDATIIKANGESISGTFNITNAGNAKNEFNISAGTFTSQVSNDYCADGFEVKANDNGTYGVVNAATAVAKIGDASYETLQAAIDAAAAGETVTLLADITLEGQQLVIGAGKSFTLDLNGKTLKVSKYTTKAAQVDVLGDLTLTDSSENKTGIICSDYTGTAGLVVCVESGGKLTMNGGTITTDGMANAGNALKIASGATVTMNGGTIKCDAKRGNRAVNITGSKNAGASFIMNGGNVVADGGDGTETVIYAIMGAYYSTLVISGSSRVSGPNAVDAANSATTISGGTFTGNIKVKAGSISGGTYDKAIDAKYCKDGFILTRNEDGSYGVKAGAYVAQIGDVKYETLAAAIAAAKTGETVTLLKNATENVEIAKEKNLTLDLNGCTLNGGTGTDKAALSNLGTITIRDTSADKAGTIKRDDNGTVGETSYYVIRNQGTMTIESGNVINNSGYKKANSTGSMVGSSLICNGDCDEGGTLTIKGGTFTQKNFIAIKNGALGVLHVTGGTISSDHSAIQNWFEADITGGEIKGQLWTDAYIKGESVGETTIGGNAKFTGEIVMDIYGSVAPTLAINGGNLSVTNWRITTAAANAGAKPAVSGGTFTSAVPEAYCAAGFIPTANADGTFGVKAGAYVAQIGDVKYESLAAAIAAAKAGETVTLLADTTEDVTINKDITLDLGGKTLTNTGSGKATVTIDKGATATVQNGSIIGGTSYYNIQNNGTATFTGVTATAGNTGSSMIDNWGTLTIESGTYEGGLNVVKSEEGSTLTINGGKFTGTYAPSSDYTAVILVYGNTTITGGEFIQSVTKTGSWAHPKVVMTGVVEGYEAFTTVTGGTFTNKKSGESIFHGLGKATSDNFEVSGGTFNKSVPDSYFKDGYFAKKTADGYTADGPYAVKIGTAAGYATLEEAFAAAKSGDTITLLTDCSGNGIKVKDNTFTGKGLTVDFAGHTYTVGGVLVGSATTGTNAFQLLKGNKITFKNGTIAGVAENTKPAEDTPNWHGAPAMVIQNYCDLTLKNMTISGGDETVYTMSNNCGNVVIENTTINAGKAKGYGYGPFAFDACGYDGYTGVSVTVKGTSAINGDIEVSRSASNENAVTLTLASGTVTGALKIDSSIKSGDATTVTKSSKVTLAAPDGYLWNAEGVLVVAVAQVGDVKYETLQAAIDAAKGGSTVRLLADVTLTETAVFPAGKKVDLNLRGYNITATGTALRINGTTDIQSTGSNGVIESTGNVAVAVGNDAKVTVYSGTLKGREGAVITGTSTGATIEIRYKATLIATDNAVIAGNGSKRDGKPNTILVKGSTFIGGIESTGYIACGIYAPWNDNVTVSGGTFNITNGAGIVARAGTVEVTGGTFNCGDGTAKGWVGDSKNKVPCAALVFDKAANYPALTDSSQILVSGGSFSTDPAANGATLTAGYAATKDESGMYKVAKENPAAEINGVKYDTLQAAINAAQATNGGATITLLKNINTSSYYEVKGDNPVTIDLAGYNITGSGISGLFYVTAKGDLTIKGEGTVTAVEDNKAAMAVWVRSPIAKVTLEGGTYTQQITNTADPHFDLIYVEYGNVYVKGGTYKGTTPDWTLNCKDGNYPDEANIEVTGGTFKGFDPANNKAEGEGTSFVPAGYVSTKGADGNYTVEEYKPVEVWTGYTGTKVASYATIEEAVANLGNNKWIVIGKDYTLTEDFTIGGENLDNLYLDVAEGATLTVAEGVTLTVAANAKRLGVRDGATLVNKGTIVVCGSSTSNGFAMLYGTFTGNELTVPEGCFLDNNGKNFFATANENAVYEITFGDGTVKKTADSTNIKGGNVKQIKLLKDVTNGGWTLDSSSVGAEVVLDLNGHTISYNGANRYYATLNVYTKVTIKNGTVKYEGSKRGAIDLVGQGDLTIERDVTIDGGDGFAIFTSGTSKLTVNGKVTANGNYAIAGNGSKDAGGYIDSCDIIVNESASITAPKGIAIYHPEKGTVTINGGTITGHTGIEMCAGQLVVNGGSITSNGDNMDATGSQNAILDGAAISIINRNYPGGVPTAVIKGGTFAANGKDAQTVKAYDYTGDKVAEWTAAGNNVNITGGTFSSIPTNMGVLCADDYKTVYDADADMYNVVKQDAKITVGKRLSIGNDLTITYLVSLTGCTNPWVKFQLYNDDIKGYTTVEVKNPGTDTVTGPDGKPMDVFTFDFTGINPQRMTDTLKATVYAEDASGNVVEYQVDDYSVAQYCSNKLAKLGQNDPLRKLIGNLVAYGAAAQVYQNYRTDNLVSTVVSGAVSTDYTDRLSSVTQYTGKVLGTAGVNIKGKTLVLSNTFAVRVYFTVNKDVDITNVSFNVTANGKTDTVNSFEKDEKLGYYYFDYANLNATQLDSEVKFESLVNGTDAGDMVTYSVNTYLAKKMPNYDKSSNAYKFMAELFNYGCACTEYASK